MPATNGSILFVDETFDGLDAFSASLADSGLRVTVAHGNEEGLRQACTMQPDVIFLDAGALGPEMSAFCKRLQALERTREIPVVFMLAASDIPRRAEIFAAGGAGYVVKPLQIEEVLAQIMPNVRMRILKRGLAEWDAQCGVCAADFRAVELHFREVFDSVSDFLYVLELDKDGGFRFVDVNLGVERLMQLPRAEIVGRYVEEVIPGAREQGVLDRLQRCVNAGSVIDAEIELDLPAGRHDFEATYFPIRENGTGAIYRVVSLARDITLRRQHEAMRQRRDELEVLFRKIVEVAPGMLGVYRLGPDGRTSMPYSSPKLEDVTGFNRDEIRQDAASALNLVHPEDRAAHIASIEESARNLTPWHNEFRVLHPKKGEIWLEGNSIPERAPDGAVIWYGFLVDITKRKRAEELLLDKEQKFRTLAENLPDVVIRYDRECRRIYVNRAFMSHVGRELDQVLNAAPGPGWKGLIPSNEYLALLRGVMSTGKPAEQLIAWRGKNGRLMHYFVHAVPERDMSGEVIGVLTIGRNITALKEAELRLAESREQLRELAAHRDTAREEERKHIARELHDELGQFLSALRMQASMLRMRFGNDNPVLTDHLNSMIKMVDSNIQMVRNIASSLRPVALDLGIVSALEWLVEEFVQYSGVCCELDVRMEKIDMGSHCATTLFRIVQESLTNVARHADARKVKISLGRTRTHYCLKVRDNGNGFDPAGIPKKSFGLLGMQERVLVLGGEMRIVSQPEKGTTVAVDIPIAECFRRG